MTITSFASTTTGCRQPYSRFEDATFSTAWPLHLRAFLGQSFGRSIGQTSISRLLLRRHPAMVFGFIDCKSLLVRCSPNTNSAIHSSTERLLEPVTLKVSSVINA